MPLELSQEKRWLRITPPGSLPLFLQSFQGREELSRLFRFELELVSLEHAVAAEDIVGKGVTFWITADGTPVRYFHGIVRRWRSGPMLDQGLRGYRAEVVPWLWFHTQTANCRIFQNQTVQEIMETLFGERGFSDYRFSLSGSHPTREFCVQYRETEFDFVSRLMEEEGMFYLFEHEDGKHTLVVADAASVYADCDENEVEFSTGTRAKSVISDWEHVYEFIPGKWAHDDYNDLTPSDELLGDTTSLVSIGGNDAYEVYDYPGRYTEAGDGATWAKTRMEEFEAAQDVSRGAGTCVSFTPGRKFTLTKHNFDAEQQAYVLTAVEHSASEGAGFTAGGGGGNEYANSFTCIPADRVFRPARLTKKPIVQGPQTAVVVGPSGEEIYVDDKGRAKVQFHWDRLGENDDKSSCWVRVSQGWADNGWGILFHPRIGQEVIVDFLEGNPDRPLITGRVYNADLMPDADATGTPTQSVIRSHSSPDGADDNFNEIRFEDAKDEELFYLHAEKDFERVVENNDTLKVGFDKQEDGDQTIDIYNNRTVTLEEGTDTLTVKKGDRIVNIDEGNHELTVSEGDQTMTVSQGDQTMTISQGDQTMTIDQGDQTITISQGDQTITLDQGSCTIEAGTAIELVVGQSSIKIETASITIASSDISISGDMTAELSSASTTISGDGNVDIDGGQVAIN